MRTLEKIMLLTYNLFIMQLTHFKVCVLYIRISSLKEPLLVTFKDLTQGRVNLWSDNIAAARTCLNIPEE